MTNGHAITQGIHMRKQLGALTLRAPALALTMYVAGAGIVGAQAPLAIDSARITISGTSNIHPYTASTSAVRVTRAQFTCALEGPDMWSNALKPGAVEAFDIAVSAAT